MENMLSRRVKEQITKNDETVRQTQEQIALSEAWLAAFYEQHEQQSYRLNLRTRPRPR